MKHYLIGVGKKKRNVFVKKIEKYPTQTGTVLD